MEANKEPQPGDLIWANRSVKGLPYNHCGIYEGAGYVIHFASPEGSEISEETAVVHRMTFEHFKDGCPVKIIDIENSLSAEETLSNARKCIEMQGYNFASFNCDHFATWCKTGEYRSIQADTIKTGLKELELEGVGGSVVKLVCEIHDIAEMLKAPRLDTVYPAAENEIEDTLETNSFVTETIPPVPDDENDIQPDYEIMEGEPYPKDETKEIDTGEDDGNEDEGLPPAKKAWYERVGGVLKFITYPVSGALEFLRRTDRIPILRHVNFIHLGAKVRNVIDNIVTGIKVFTGRLTKEQAYEERMNNEAALAGYIIAEKQNQPVKERLKQTFGVIGSKIKHIVQQAVTRIVPAPVRNAIKTGARKIGTAFATGVKTFFQKAKEKAKSFFGSIKRKLFG
jgi:hypothetical protein